MLDRKTQVGTEAKWGGGVGCVKMSATPMVRVLGFGTILFFFLLALYLSLCFPMSFTVSIHLLQNFQNCYFSNKNFFWQANLKWQETKRPRGIINCWLPQMCLTGRGAEDSARHQQHGLGCSTDTHCLPGSGTSFQRQLRCLLNTPTCPCALTTETMCSQTTSLVF